MASQELGKVVVLRFGGCMTLLERKKNFRTGPKGAFVTSTLYGATLNGSSCTQKMTSEKKFLL